MSLSEQATRKQLIDKALEAAGWKPIVRYDPSVSRDLIALEEYPTTNGPADYALFHDGEPLAIVEAKKLAVGPQNVLKQAQRYAQGLFPSPFDFGDYHVPFIYSTNGKIIWFQDLRDPHSRSRQVTRFHTPAALREMLDRDVDTAMDWLCTNPVSHSILRPYQLYALRTQWVRDYFASQATGTSDSMRNISQVKIRGAPVALAPLAEQRRIVARIEALFAQADALEEAATVAHCRLEQVDQAVLARAFREELVAQDLEDQPASVLLERIRAERDSSG